MGVQNLRRNLPFLRELKNRNLTKRRRQQLLEAGGDPLIKCLGECCHNVLTGNVRMSETSRKRLKRFAKNIRQIGDPKVGVRRKKTLLLQRGGLLPALLGPIISAVTGLVGGLLNK